ncbi:hypothetical protein Ancab_002263, partial [Ancistrocladus abbreviatus]
MAVALCKVTANLSLKHKQKNKSRHCILIDHLVLRIQIVNNGTEAANFMFVKRECN